MPLYVFDFSQGSKDQKDLLGGKGANLAEMTNLGLPVPPGFTITTEACRHYLATGSEPEELAGEVDKSPGCAWKNAWASDWEIRRTRCWSRCGPVRSSPCRG